ncbi:MAG: hypothetical protein M3319_03465 [Actinomycetota bacterium]|nr:hypothetical protein [Actinomycetota bacterium]
MPQRGGAATILDNLALVKPLLVATVTAEIDGSAEVAAVVSHAESVHVRTCR